MTGVCIPLDVSSENAPKGLAFDADSVFEENAEVKLFQISLKSFKVAPVRRDSFPRNSETDSETIRVPM
jgi:hypothetical protein